MCSCKDKTELTPNASELEENLVSVKLISEIAGYYRGSATQNLYGYRKPGQIFRVFREDAELGARIGTLEIV